MYHLDLTMATKGNWTDADDKRAVSEGWSLFNLPDQRRPDRKPDIERIDDMDTFQTDMEAWVHIWKRANVEDSPFHLKVIRILKAMNPEEFQMIEQYLLTSIDQGMNCSP
jgi:hypothetical protein